ncbi:hypothetical protein C2S52_023654 [Perilla frutescens var. hirtella]|nr:hypothetical protein C2S52_023654 [Perilla frutescens var. hirtella]
MVMWRACRKPRNPAHLIKDFRVLNCSSLSKVKQMTLHAVSQAVEFLETFTLNDASRNHVKAPHVDSDVQETCIPLRDLMFMKQEMETKISTLQKQGHLVQPHIRAYMEKSIQNFLVRIDKEMLKNFVGTSSSS